MVAVVSASVAVMPTAAASILVLARGPAPMARAVVVVVAVAVPPMLFLPILAVAFARFARALFAVRADARRRFLARLLLVVGSAPPARLVLVVFVSFYTFPSRRRRRRRRRLGATKIFTTIYICAIFIVCMRFQLFIGARVVRRRGSATAGHS